MTKKKTAAKPVKKTAAKKSARLERAEKTAALKPHDISPAVKPLAEEVPAQLTPPAGFTFAGSVEAADAGRDMLRTGGFEPHAESPVLVDAGVRPPPDAPAATIVTEPTGEVVLKIDPDVPASHPFLESKPFELAKGTKPIRIGSAEAVLPCCRVCGGEMKSNICPADGYHLVDAP